MKKSLLITICILFVVAILCGCNHKDTKKTDNTPITAQSTENSVNKEDKNISTDEKANSINTNDTECYDNESDKSKEKVNLDNSSADDKSESNKKDEATSALSDDCGEVEIDFSELE